MLRFGVLVFIVKAMKKLKTQLLKSAALLPLVLALSDCKKDAAAETAEAPKTVEVEAKPSNMTLSSQSAKLGFAGNLPISTEFYLASANLKQHAAALKASAFGKDVAALISDKTPAPSAGDTTMTALKNLWGDDFFIAGAKGFAKSAELLREMNHLMNEMNFKQIMAGSTGTLGLSKSATNPFAMIEAALHDAPQMRRVKQFVAKFELPPLIMGFKAEKPADVVKELLPEEMLKKAAENATITELTTADGAAFKVMTFEGAKLLPKEMQEKMLGNLPKDIEEDVKVSLEQIITSIQAKKFVFAVGSTPTHVLFAFGKNVDHLQFVKEPEESVLANAEMNWLVPHASKNLITIAYANAAVMTGLADDQPVTPMVRGIVSAMKESKLFKEAGGKLEKNLSDLSSLESVVYTQQATAMVAAAWWEKGLKVETFGGVQPRAFTQTAPLKFARFINVPGVLFGMDFQRNPEYEKAVRAWLEKLSSMAYDATKEIVQAGVLGEDGGKQFAMFDQMVLPAVKKLYAADRDLNEKGLGPEMAILLDLNGKMPQIPMLPTAQKGTKFPRFSTLHDVADRKEIGLAWKSMSDTIGGLNKALTGGAVGGQPDGSALQPASSEKRGMTFWTYDLPFFTGDVYPCAAISDKLLVLSTSQDAADALGEDLSKPAPDKTEGLVWRFDMGAFTTFLGTAAALSPTQTPEQLKDLKQTLRWLRPFGQMNGHSFEQNGQWRSTFSWEISAVLSFD